MRRLLLLPVIAALAACPGPVDTGADGGGPIVVGPSGGKFFRDGAVIDIPANAVASDTTITVTLIDVDCTGQISTLTCVPGVPNRSRISVGYRFSPITLKFNEPVSIYIPYLEDRLPAKGIDKATYDLRRGDGDDPYLELPSPTTLSDPAPVVKATTEKLGLFWVTSPQKAAVSEIALSPNEATLSVGQTQQFTATVTDPAGNPLPDVEVKWSIVPARVASVDATGLVTALAPGTATLTATAGDAQKTATIYVPGTTVGPTTFIHENPFPTGNDLYGGGMANGYAFFVGANATVLSRSPANDWARLFSNPGLTLRAAAGAFPQSAVAVGQSGQAGILVEMDGSSTVPKVSSFQTVLPRALWFDGTFGMAVGYGNDVLLRQNGVWATRYSPSFETLMDVIGDGAGGFTTVGDRGSIYQYDPATQTWNSLFDTQLSVLFVDAAITQPDGSEAWGVGANKLWHFVTNGWTPINLPASPAVDALTALGVIDGKVVVGARKSKQGYLFVYSPGDGTWTSKAIRAPQLIRGVFGEDASGYAVGDFGAIWQYANGTFTEVSSGFYGDVADVYAAQGVAVAAVNECDTADCTSRTGRVVMRDANGAWKDVGFPVFSGQLFAVAARSATDIWAVGEGLAWHYDGSSWGAPSALSSLPIRDIAVCGNDYWAVGDSGTVFKGTTALVPQQPQGTRDLYAIHCQSGTERWYAGDYALYRNTTLVNDPATNPAPWRAVWSPAANEAFAFGENSYGVYWNTQSMTKFVAPGGIPPEAIRGMWGSSIDNLYAVGFTVNPFTFGYAVRFNGVQWSMVDQGSSRIGTSVSGSSATDIYIGTEGGGILRGVMPQ